MRGTSSSSLVFVVVVMIAQARVRISDQVRVCHTVVTHGCYESPLGTRSFMRHIATQDFPVSPELTRDYFHTVFPLFSLGHDVLCTYMILSFVRYYHCRLTHAELNAAMSQFLTTDCKIS